MPERSWFYAAGGQQQGPYGETQFRDLVARGAVTAETLVWTEGMSGWQKLGGGRAGAVVGCLTAAGRSAIGWRCDEWWRRRRLWRRGALH